MRSITRIGVAVVAVLMLAGCRDGDPASTVYGELAAGGTAFDLLTQSGSYHRHQHTLTVAEETLVERCMAAKGLHYPVRTPAPVHGSDEERTLSLEQRRKEGYGLFASYTADPTDGRRSPAPADRYVQQLPERERSDYILALFGDESMRKGIRLAVGGEVTFPGSGCVFDSQNLIYGDIMTWARITYIPEELNNKLTGRVVASAEYTTTMGGWSTCMARQGHDFPGPSEAKNHLAERYAAEGATEHLRADEIAVAVTDADCARQHGVPRLVLSLKERELASLTDQERRSLVELAGSWLKAVDVAETIAG
jgi:hypothetical protein